MWSTKRNQLRGQSLGGSQNSTFAQSSLLVRANFLFLFAHDTTSRNNTNEGFAKKRKILLADYIVRLGLSKHKSVCILIPS